MCTKEETKRVDERKQNIIVRGKVISSRISESMIYEGIQVPLMLM